METIYLDNNATTRMDDEVFAAILPYFQEFYGNPSSTLHFYGQQADYAVRQARGVLADCFHAASENDFIFTSGATEANNLAILGIARASKQKHPHVIVSSIEHPSVFQVCRQLEREGAVCTYLPADPSGVISVLEVERAITTDTILLSIMSANNEIGTIQPIEELGRLAHRHNILFHTDATQYVGYRLINVSHSPVDLMSVSGHKIYGPKGIGLLYAGAQARRVLKPQLYGGGQQNNLRSGTLNVPGIVGLAKAVELLARDQDRDSRRIAALRDSFLSLLQRDISVVVNGTMEERIPNNISFYIPGVSALWLASKLPELAFSMGSACATGSTQGSHVLAAIGLGSEQIDSTVRVGLSKFTSEEEVERAARLICGAIRSQLGEGGGHREQFT